MYVCWNFLLASQQRKFLDPHFFELARPLRATHMILPLRITRSLGQKKKTATHHTFAYSWATAGKIRVPCSSMEIAHAILYETVETIATLKHIA